MELRQLRYFVAVAEELHFRRAAERLNMSQPPLSVQIRELERELGVGLFERTQQGVRMTQAGRVLLVDARRVLDEVALAARNVRSAADGELGEIRIALTQSAEFLSFLPETIQNLRARYTGVVVSLRQMPTAEQIEAVTRQQLHMGISRRPAGKLPRHVQLLPLCADPLMLVVHGANELAQCTSVRMRDLRDRMFVLAPADAQSGLYEAVMRLALDARFFPRVAQEVRQITSTIGMVAAGVGIAILPASARCIRIGHVAFIPIDDLGAESWLHVIRHGGAQSRVLAELGQMLQDAVASLTGPAA